MNGSTTAYRMHGGTALFQNAFVFRWGSGIWDTKTYRVSLWALNDNRRPVVRGLDGLEFLT